MSIVCSSCFMLQEATNICSADLQAKAAAEFLNVMKRYLESLCSDLRSYTITNVQANNDRVSVTKLIIHLYSCIFLYLGMPRLLYFFDMRVFGYSFQVSLLLKDSFIDSFPSRDRPFIKVILGSLIYCNLCYYGMQFSHLLARNEEI